MPEITAIERVISQDDRISSLFTYMPAGEPVKIVLSDRIGVLMDETTYDGLIETIRILQENPATVQSLDERERGVFIDEADIHDYV